MRVVMTSLAVLALVACSKPAPAPADNDAMAEANGIAADANLVAADANAMDAATTSDAIKHTSWEYTDEKNMPIQESVDDAGNYIAVSSDKHVDHGTAVMKDGKACFTSAMTKDGEMCWTDPKLAVGQSGETVSDKGEKLTVKRVEYHALTMPAAN